MNIVWFRSDLRVTDNPALYAASQKTGGVRAVFCITAKQWTAHSLGNNKISFILASLLELKADLNKLNISLDILECATYKDSIKALEQYAAQLKCTDIYFNFEYELNERQRDTDITKLFKQKSINVHAFHEQCLIAPNTIINKQQKPYTVYTPFKKACYIYLHEHSISTTPLPKKQSLDNVHDSNTHLSSTNKKYLDNKILHIWPAGTKQALKRLHDFCDNQLLQYKVQRDYPAINGTSSLSAYLAVGSISVRQCYIAAIEQNKQQFASGNQNVICWISELLWRDFYRNIILYFPEICKGANFNHKYDKLKWQKPNDKLEKWQNGQTGIPIIDAAMRQLVSTGWMHNRLRMITAMFLSKNLLIDWRHGEQFFSQHLIDLDFASNNGGWQWSASTGTDAVPYFRIFNPITQSKNFDPEAKFIKHYVPELAKLDAKVIHDPSACLTPQELDKLSYPKIMVDLKETRNRAIEAFGAC